MTPTPAPTASDPAEVGYSLDELCALVELPKRTARYYMQIGLVDRPEGFARGTRYRVRHLEQLLAIRKWQRAGLSLERIGELLAAPDTVPVPPKPRGRGSVEVVSRLVIAEGVELILDPARDGLSPEEVRELFRRVMAAYDQIRNDKDGNHG
jgi:DNA-binding transcriptional MerR regulator